jgi:hypothetical protein
MKRVAAWVISSALACGVQLLADTFLPAGLGRFSLIVCGGFAALMWHYFIDEPLREWGRA